MSYCQNYYNSFCDNVKLFLCYNSVNKIECNRPKNTIGTERNMAISTEMSQTRQQKAREYARIRHRLFFVNTGIAVVLLVLSLVTGLSLELRKLVESWTANQWLAVPLYLAIFGTVYAMLTFPLDIYSGYILPTRYGALNQSFKLWLLDLAKGGLLAVVLGLPLLEALY